MKKLKPAHIMTERPEQYAALIERYRAEFAGITAGPTPPSAAKYVFECLRTDANILVLARALRLSHRNEIRTQAGTVRRNVAPAMPWTHLHYVYPPSMQKLIAAGTADRWMLTTGWAIHPSARVCVYGVAPDRTYAEVKAAVKRAMQAGLPQTVDGMDIRDVSTRQTAFPLLPIPAKQRHLQNTALLLTVYGNDAVRNRATRTALAQLGRLDPLPSVYLLELGHASGGDFADVSELIPGTVYYYRQLDERYRGIFQKESAFNWLIRRVRYLHSSVQYFICHDSDTYPTRANWAECVRNMLTLVPAGQTWMSYDDTRDPSFHGYSACAAKQIGWKGRCNPGLSWGITYDLWQEVGGWNTRGICGAGDTLWYSEIRGDMEDLKYMMRWSYFAGQIRNLQRLVPNPGSVAVEMVHCWHGDRKDRAYNVRHEIIDHFAPIDDLIEEDAEGFLRFKTPGSQFQQAIIRRGEAVDGPSVERLLRAVGSTRPVSLKAYHDPVTHIIQEAHP